jgi:uncharacterized protein YodC (DUF2158 family)
MPTEGSYTVGDLVVLKSGGPVMTVYEISPSGTNVNCNWFVGGKLHHGNFPMSILEPARQKKAGPL